MKPHLKVLIVDDVALNRKLLRLTLEDENLQALEASDGRQAFELLEREEVDAVISDILMPNIDGYRLCYEVRKSRRWQHLPFIIYTSTYTSAGDEKLSLDLGADKFIRKPASAEVLKQALAEVLKAQRRTPARIEPPAELTLLKEYTARLVSKLEEKNQQLAHHVEQLQDTQSQLGHLLAHAPAVIYRLKIEQGSFTPTLVSGNIEQMLGYKVQETMSLAWWKQCLHPDDAVRMEQVAARMLQGEGHSTEYRLRHKDGSYRWVQDNNRVLLNPAGEPAECIGVWINTTGRKQSEARERLLNTALRAAANAIVITDKKGAITWANPAFSQLTGYSLQEVYGRNPNLLKSGAQDEGFYRNLWETILAGSVWRGEFINRRKDGTVYTEESIITPVRDEGGQISHFIAIKEDVTHNRRTHEELRWKTAFLQALVDSSLDGILVVDSDGKRLLQNQQMLKVWKMPPEIAGQQEDARQIAFALQQVKNPGQFADKVAYLYAHPNQISRDEIELVDGTILDRYSSPVVSANGNNYGRIWTFRDTTERRQLESQLRQAQKMEAFGQLAGGVAHDFNNLLAVIRGNIELVLMENEQAGPSAECLKQAVGACERAANLTRQLLIFSRKQVFQTQGLPLNDLVKNLTKMLQRVIPENIQWRYAYMEQPSWVEVDPGMLEQALLNLVVNARDAMPGGGELAISTAHVPIDEAYAKKNPEARPGDFVCLEVRDTGTGIAPEHLHRIFEPFFTTKEVGKGTGLGLASVFGIVQQHKGWLEVDSCLGQGSTFKLFFPAIAPPEKITTAPFAQPELRGGTETILLVEDDFAVRTITRQVLETFNYKVYDAASGREAVGLWENQGAGIDLLLTDIVMPEGMSGRDVAEQIRAQKPQIKVIFMSGYSAEIVGKETNFFRRVKSFYLHKPFSSQTLIQTVRQCLDEPAPA